MIGSAEELRRFLEAAPTERLEVQVRRLVEQILEPERRRIEELLKGGASVRQIEADMPLTQEDVSRQALKLMELAVTERVQEIDWPPEITPTTLRKVKLPPLDPHPLYDRWKWMMLTQAGVIDHNAFVTVTETPEESAFRATVRPGIMVTDHGPFVKEYRRAVRRAISDRPYEEERDE